MWWQLDPVFIVASLAAAVAGLFVRALRPIAIGTLAFTAFMLRPGGYLPVPYVIMLIPFGALLITGVTDAAVRSVRRARIRARVLRTAWLAGMLEAVVAVVPLWGRSCAASCSPTSISRRARRRRGSRRTCSATRRSLSTTPCGST